MAKPRLGLLGLGGLGGEMLKLLELRPNVDLWAVCDKSSFLFTGSEISRPALLEHFARGSSLSSFPGAVSSTQSVQDLLRAGGKELEALFLALPNLPNTFFPDLIDQIAASGDFQGVIVDALKRSSAVQAMQERDQLLRQAQMLYISGCGATPGMLTAAAQLASQSFVEVLNVEIIFGVGIQNWQAYRATIREDIAHLPGFNPDKAAALSETEIEALLDSCGGVLELVNMEHADDVMLELAGVCPADRVTVGGLVDTRNPKKPTSTRMTLTGRTYTGAISAHTFVLGDETTMAANVNGTALGYLNAGLIAYEQNKQRGFLTALDLSPRFASSGTRVPQTLSL